jgi:hypothetical protein
MKIRAALYRAFANLGADKKLPATIGSWGDALDDAEVLELLKMWNDGQLGEN